MTEFICIDSDSEPDEGPLMARRNRRVSAQDVRVFDDNDSSDTAMEDPVIMPPPSRRRRSPDPGDFMDDEQFEQYLAELSGNATRSLPQEEAAAAKSVISSYTHNGRTYREGKAVELNDGTFLRVREVAQDTHGSVFLRGWRMERFEDMESIMPRRINELCWIVNLEPGQTEADAIYDEVSLNNVKGMRVIRFTNYQYPRESAMEEHGGNPPHLTRQEGRLYCRTKYVRVWVKKTAREKRVSEAAIVFLTQEEADHGFSVSADEIRHAWRGTTRECGSFVERQNHDQNRPSLIDLSTPGPIAAQDSSYSERIQKYTFGDGFCGAGGVSRGAEEAGMHIAWGFDCWSKAMDSYRLNFPTAVGETSEVVHFLTNLPEDIKVDVMHFSPPCQPFSPAKTVAAASDDANEACLFSARELLARVKPRIATMEETSGIIERHKEFLYATIHNFVDLGYSVGWKLLYFQDYGLPQHRKRVIVVGAGPGETLPSFPPPTHGDPESGLLPYRTIIDAISGLASDAPDHNPDRFIFNNPKPPYDPHRFSKTVTCNGGDQYHPSGTRNFTHREAACLQTFPLEHQFCSTGVLKQIGNAVPPMVAKTLFRHIIKHLERTDGKRGPQRS